MTHDEQLKANLIIAKALTGLPVYNDDIKINHRKPFIKVGSWHNRYDNKEVFIHRPEKCTTERPCLHWFKAGNIHYDSYAFNIFADDTDLKNAVIHLGEKHGRYPRPYGFGWTCRLGIVGEDDVYNTYQEAVAAAYLTLEKQGGSR